jgi:hypothetical protein
MNRILVLLLTVVFGLFFLAAGVAGVALEYRTPPVHTTHLFAFLFLVLLGAVLMPGVGTIIFARLKDGAALAEDFVPHAGRRASQGEVAIAPTTPAKPDAMPGEGGPS